MIANTKPDRSLWSAFPSVSIHTDVKTAKSHADYVAAKAGDVLAAKRLTSELLSVDALTRITRQIGAAHPYLLGVGAIEEAGTNVIPLALAEVIAERLGLPLATGGIVQINTVGHTGATGWHRLAWPALFDGQVEKGAKYVLVDDFIGQGGTLANLRGFIERRGGKEYSAIMSLSRETLSALRNKHGGDLEIFWQNEFGYGLEYLTESEAHYLLRTEDVDTIRDQLVAARRGNG